MNDNRLYLYTANGSYFGHCMVALAFVLPVAYGIIDRGGIDVTVANVMMFPLGVTLLLSFAAMTEACMMIKDNKYLFSYNVDKAICVSLDAIPWDSAVAIARKLYGPVLTKTAHNTFRQPQNRLSYEIFFMDLSSCYSVFRLFRHATMPLMQFGQLLSRQN